MKPLNFLVIAVLFSALFITACADQNKEDVRNQAVESVNVPPPTAPGVPPATTPTAVNNSGVIHYTCPNNCAGSGGAAAGTCPVCGTAYAHNQAFHNTSTPPPGTVTTPGATTPNVTPVPNPTTSQAQNAAGAYHYTCGAGCAGGAAAAGTCAVCGGALAHNQAFHN